DALAFELGAIGVVLELDAEMADLVGRLDEGAADIVVADDAELEGQAALRGVAQGRGHAGIGDGHDDVGGHMALARELHADPLPRLVDIVAVDDAVGPREIDVLEDAEALAATPERPAAVEAGGVDDDELAGLDVAHELGAD